MAEIVSPGGLRLPDPVRWPEYRSLVSAIVQAWERAPEGGKWEAIKGYLRAAVRADLYVLARLLGYDDESHPWDEIHLLMAHRIREYEKLPAVQVAIFQPRGTYKTALEEIQFTRRILVNPEIRIGVGSWKLGVAEAITRAIRRNLQDPWIRALFPEVVPARPDDAEKWTEAEFTVLRSSASHDATVLAFSLESLPAGKHFDVLGLDDVVESRSTETPEAVEKADAKLRDIRSLRAGVHAQTFLRGTFWDPEDTHVKIFEGRIKGWRVERHPIRVDAVYQEADNPFGLPLGACVFPSVKPPATIQADEDGMGPWQFSTQMQLTIPSALLAAWTKAQVQRYYDPRILEPPIHFVVTVDLATERGKDNLSVMLAAVLPDGRRCIVSGFDGHAAPSWVASYLYDLQRSYGTTTYIEEIGMAVFFDEAIRHEGERRGYYLPNVVPIKRRETRKFDRLWQLDGPIKRGLILTRDPEAPDLNPQEKAFFSAWERFALTFPRATKDDIGDCAADLLAFGPIPSTDDIRRGYQPKAFEPAPEPEFSERMGF